MDPNAHLFTYKGKYADTAPLHIGRIYLNYVEFSLTFMPLVYATLTDPAKTSKPLQNLKNEIHSYVLTL